MFHKLFRGLFRKLFRRLLTGSRPQWWRCWGYSLACHQCGGTAAYCELYSSLGAGCWTHMPLSPALSPYFPFLPSCPPFSSRPLFPWFWVLLCACSWAFVFRPFFPMVLARSCHASHLCWPLSPCPPFTIHPSLSCHPSPSWCSPMTLVGIYGPPSTHWRAGYEEVWTAGDSHVLPCRCGSCSHLGHSWAWCGGPTFCQASGGVVGIAVAASTDAYLDCDLLGYLGWPAGSGEGALRRL